MCFKEAAQATALIRLVFNQLSRYDHFSYIKFQLSSDSRRIYVVQMTDNMHQRT